MVKHNNEDSPLTQQQRSVLTIYLRDYYSLYHHPRKRNGFRSTCPIDVEDVVKHWVQVELGATGSSSQNGVELPYQQKDIANAVATTLSWPRTCLCLWVTEESIANSSEKTLIDLPCLLSPFDGEVRLCQNTTYGIPSKYLLQVKSLSIRGEDQSTITDEAFRHLTNLQSLDIQQCNQ